MVGSPLMAAEANGRKILHVCLSLIVKPDVAYLTLTLLVLKNYLSVIQFLNCVLKI